MTAPLRHEADGERAKRDSDGAELCDVLVIGGGPAGSTAATLLAMEGHAVVLAEKETHPRFHIGELLLPRNLQIFDRLGVHDEIQALGVRKPGGEFVHDATGRSTAFLFADGIASGHQHAYQVRRADFDAALFANARRHGARTFENTQVTSLSPTGPDGRSTVTTSGPEARTFAPRFVLDASGRDTFLASRMRIKEANKDHSTAALYAHFHGVTPRRPELAGYITVHLVDNGWFWSIPLPDGVTSIGFVGDRAAFRDRQTDIEAFFDARLAASVTLSERLANATRVTEVMSAGNYSYRATTNWGDGYMMIGDVYAFVDPIFSSGVLLAMTSAEMGAAVASRWLKHPAAGRSMAKRAQRRLMRQMDRLNWLIYRINTPVLRNLFLLPSNQLRMRDGLVSLLAGNIQLDRRDIVPVMAFKAIYYIMTLGYRLFGKLPGDPRPVRP